MLERVNSSCVRIRMKEKIKNLTPSQSNTKPSMFFNHSLTRSDVQRSTNLTPRSRSEEEEEDMLKVVSKSFLKILVFVDTAFRIYTWLWEENRGEEQEEQRDDDQSIDILQHNASIIL